jgi:hypothetical protein
VTDTPLPLSLRIAQNLTRLLLFYWGLVALVYPVMIWDAHTYNLARIEIARLGGLFGNQLWLGERQIMLPWSFDALHLPAIIAGAGYGLPSFLCLLGVLVATKDLLTRHVSSAAAIWAGLALVAMPTLMYQAVSSKNDIPVLFAVACWAVALDRWIEQPKLRWTAIMALALSFGVGAKSSGVPLGFALGIWTLFATRKKWRHGLCFGVLCIPFLLLLGSIETYINNHRVFGTWLGAEWFVQSHANSDGLRGFGANMIRYTLGNLNFGVEFLRPHPPSYAWLEQSVDRILDSLGLVGAGCRPDYKVSTFLKNGGEAGSDFGLVGTLAIVAVTASLITLRWRSTAFRLALAALCSIALVSFTTAWMPWNARFLLLPFTLGACVIGVLAGGPRQHPFLSWILLAGLTVSALAAPLQSMYRPPSRLASAITDRDRVMTSERPAMHEIVSDLKNRALDLQSGLLLHSGSDSWVFAVMHRMPFPITPLPYLETLNGTSNKIGSHILIMDKELPELSPDRFAVVHRYRHSQSFLVRITSSSTP